MARVTILRCFAFGIFLYASLAGTVAAAAQVTVSMHDGLVSIKAQQAPVGDILREWTRVGGTVFVNSESVAATPASLELTEVPEKEALSILLRTASGFLAMSRSAMSAGSNGASSFSRIVILPGTAMSTTTMASMPASRTPAPEPLADLYPGVRALIGPDGRPVTDDQEGAPPYVPTPRQPRQPAGDSPSPNMPISPKVPANTPNGVSGATLPVGTSAPGMMIPPAPPEQR